MTGWGFADLWQRLAAVHPTRTAFIHAGRRLTWAQFDRSTNTLARRLSYAGVGAGDVVAISLTNRPEYLIAFAATLRIGASPANVNYRYRGPETADLLTLLDPAAVVFDHRSQQAITSYRGLFDRVKLCVAVRDTDDPDPAGRPAWAVAWTDLMSGCGALSDLSVTTAAATIIKCTGGTTARPTAVRWNERDLFAHLNDHNPWVSHDTGRPVHEATPAVADARLALAAPLIHGTALTRALGALCAGGTVITVPGGSFDPAAVLDTIETHAPDTLAIVGDAHAAPLAELLSSNPGRWPLTALRTVTSSGATWSARCKRQLLAAAPHLELIETLGATEATGLGHSRAAVGSVPDTGTFRLGRYTRVVRDDGSTAEVGDSGSIGVSRPHPIGLHPSQPLPADRFVTLAETGETVLLSGDHARVLTGGRFAFLGRGADCINTGGEKVYAPEVREILMSHPAVADAAVFAMPHARLGNIVAALIVVRSNTDLEHVLAHARSRLAGYKVPSQAHLVDEVPRTTAGKIDLPQVVALAAERAGQ